MDIFLNICSPFDLQSNSQVWIVRAWHSNDAHLGLNANLKHGHTGVSTKKYNLIMEAESTTEKTQPVACGEELRHLLFLPRSLRFVPF